MKRLAGCDASCASGIPRLRKRIKVKSSVDVSPNVEDEAQRTEVCSGGLVKKLPSIVAFAKWIEQNGGSLPRKQTPEQLTNQNCQEEHRMFHFLKLQKEAYSRGRLKTATKDCLAKLTRCDFKTRKESWEKQYEALKILAEEGQEGSSDKLLTWKSKDVKVKKMRKWILEQRNLYKTGSY